MLDLRVYKLVSRLMAWVLGPMAALGLGVPLYLQLQEPWPTWIGQAFFVLTAVVATGNLYLNIRTLARGAGAGAYPAVLSMALIPACLLLGPRAGGPVLAWCVFAVPVAIALDFLGQAMLAQWLWPRVRHFFCGPDSPDEMSD